MELENFLGFMDGGDYLRANFSPTTPARTLGSAFQPSATRPVLCIYTIRITTPQAGGNQEGRVDLLSDTANPPTTVRESVDIGINTAGGGGLLGSAAISAVKANGVLVYLCPRGHFIQMNSVNVAATPTFSIVNQVELVL
jgi:hypothetical protein